MKLKNIVFLAALAPALGACQTTPQEPSMQWISAANRRPVVPGDPKFEVAKTICTGEAGKAASSMDPIYYRGLIGAVQAGQIEAQRTDTLKAVVLGCMAERGFLRVPAR